MCSPKCVGGLGITNLDTQNACLLSKWLVKMLNEEGTWQLLLKRKYLGEKTLTEATKPIEDSQFWTGLMEIKDHLFESGRFLVQSRKQTRFWEDWWIGHKPLMQQYPTLYNIVRRKKSDCGCYSQ